MNTKWCERKHSTTMNKVYTETNKQTKTKTKQKQKQKTKNKTQTLRLLNSEEFSKFMLPY